MTLFWNDEVALFLPLGKRGEEHGLYLTTLERNPAPHTCLQVLKGPGDGRNMGDPKRSSRAVAQCCGLHMECPHQSSYVNAGISRGEMLELREL